MTEILCPRASGVLAALGLVVSERRRDVQRASCSVDELDAGRRRARRRARTRAAHRVACELRYRGQAFELAVERADDLREALRGRARARLRLPRRRTPRSSSSRCA